MAADLDAALRAIAADPVLAEPGGDAGAVAAYLYDRHYRRPGQPGVSASDDGAFLATLRAANPIVPPPGAIAETVTPGHYVMLGREPLHWSTGRQVRFYWNVRAEAAAALLTRIGCALERRRVRFQCKVPVTMGGYDRADGGVLYVAAEDVAAIVDLVAEIHRTLGTGLRPDVPLFARRIADGLGFAESPQSGESFGMQRCRLLAEGLVAARAQGRSPYDAMAEHLARSGIRPDRPELNPGSAYPYDFAGPAA